MLIKILIVQKVVKLNEFWEEKGGRYWNISNNEINTIKIVHNLLQMVMKLYKKGTWH